MRISRKKPRGDQSIKKRLRTNNYIRSPKLRLIGDQGENIGVIETSKALEMARERGLDLVEVSPLANPPVAKLVDYSKMRYQEEKERRKEKAKQKKIEIKGIRLSLRIGSGDLQTRIKQAEKFLNQDDKVKIELILKGRERQHVNLAKEIINKFIASLNELVETQVEGKLSIQGGKISILVAKK